MKLFFVTNSITKATRDTLGEVATKSFSKLTRLLDEDSPDQEATIRVSVEKEGNEFVVITEIMTSKRGSHISKCQNMDIRRAINDCSSEMKRILSKHKDKITSRRKSTVKVDFI